MTQIVRRILAAVFCATTEEANTKLKADSRFETVEEKDLRELQEFAESYMEGGG